MMPTSELIVTFLISTLYAKVRIGAVVSSHFNNSQVSREQAMTSSLYL